MSIRKKYEAFVEWVRHVASLVGRQARQDADLADLRIEHATSVAAAKKELDSSLEAVRIEYAKSLQTVTEAFRSEIENLKAEVTANDAWAAKEIARKFGPETSQRKRA